MRCFLPSLALLVFTACGPAVPDLGGLSLPQGDPGLSVKKQDTSMLEFFMDGTGAYAPAATATVKARIEEQYGSFKFTEGTAAWKEAHRFTWKSVTSDKATGAFTDDADNAVVTVEASSSSPGVLALHFTSSDAAANRLSLSFKCAAGDHFLGFGAQADAIDHRGHTVPIWTSEPGIGKNLDNDDYPELWMLVGTRHASSWGLPEWLSSRGYVGVVETDRRSVFELCSKRDDAWRVEVWGTDITLWVFTGSGAEVPLTQAAKAVLGLPARPPPVAFAPWNDALFGSANVRAVAKELRDNKVPSSLIWTEDFRGGVDQPPAYRLVEDWDLDRTLYPDAEAVGAELQAQGIDWLAYFNTFIVEGNPVYDAALAGDHFVKDSTGAPYLFSGPTFKQTGLADLSDPATREWVKSYMRAVLDAGFTGWMADYGEWLPHDAVLKSGEDPMEAHNRYAREWAKLNQEVLAERTDGKQYVFFSRSGWFGSNAMSPVVWGGDQRTDFQPDDGLPTVLPLGINLGLAAVSTFGSDIAGYQSATNGIQTKELFFRWSEIGALSPVMRTHHGTNAHDGWRFDTDAETLAHYKRWATLHIQLFPYFDGNSAIAETSGIPLIRCLALEFPEDEPSWTLMDEYLLGHDILVAPVHEDGARSRTVHLPPGEWVTLDGQTRLTGPKDLTADAPLTEVPVYLRAGAIVPLLPPTVETLVPAEAPTVDLDDVKDQRVVWVVPGAAGSFTERDGTTYTLTQASGTAFKENGAELPACTSATQRGCVELNGKTATARLTGQGPLDFPGGTLSVSGHERTLDVEVLGLN